jgi:hypothetical protein
VAPLPAEFSPIPYDLDAGQIMNSPATNACDKIGGHLPSLKDYQMLFDYFSGPQGHPDFLALFPDCVENGAPMPLWTSTGIPKGPRYINRWDTFGDPNNPTHLLAVRCVLYPEIPVTVPAMDRYTTSLGFTFVQIQSGPFAKGWKDPSGVIWSSDQGKFSNPPTGNSAEQICAKMGGKLPGFEDYVRLASYFEQKTMGAPTPIQWQTYRFTTKGLSDFFSLFPNAPNREFWTSTPSEEGPDIFGTTFVFSLYVDGASIASPGAGWRTDTHAIRCMSW